MIRQRHSGLPVVLVWLAPALVAALLAAAPPESPAALPPDVALVPADAAWVLGFRPGDLWTADFTKPVREKMAKDVAEAAAGLEIVFGSPSEQVERLLIVALSLHRGSDVAVVTLKKPYDRARLVEQLAGPKAKEEKYKGRTLYAGHPYFGDAVCLLDERTYVIAYQKLLRSFLDRSAARQPGPLGVARQVLAAQHHFVLGLDLRGFLEEIGPDLPAAFESLKPLLQARTALLTADIGPESKADLELTFADAAAARKALAECLDDGRGGTAAAWTALANGLGSPRLLGLVKVLSGGTKAEVDGVTLKAGTRARLDPLVLAEVVVQAVPRPGRTRARTPFAQNLKQIVRAMHKYHDTYKCLPPAAVYDKSGKPLFSWRVSILPFLDQAALFGQFHPDEPWDSEHNIKLLDKIPVVYRTPGDEKRSGRTLCQALVGRGAAFEGKKGLSFAADFPDGTVNTIMVVEAAEGVPWTKPEDVPYDPAKPLPKFGGMYESGFHALLCDGSVYFLRKTVKPEMLHRLIQRNDGYPIPNDF
jgi:hypothetical protein